MSLSFLNINDASYINPTCFSQECFIYKILCSFTFCPYTINVTESSWKCVTVLVKKNICVKIPFHTIWARKAALVRNYFSRCNNFSLNGSWLLSLSRSVIFDQINTDIIFKWVHYYTLYTLIQHEWQWMGLKTQAEI